MRKGVNKLNYKYLIKGWGKGVRLKMPITHICLRV